MCGIAVLSFLHFENCALASLRNCMSAFRTRESPNSRNLTQEISVVLLTFKSQVWTSYLEPPPANSRDRR